MNVDLLQRYVRSDEALPFELSNFYYIIFSISAWTLWRLESVAIIGAGAAGEFFWSTPQLWD